MYALKVEESIEVNDIIEASKRLYDLSKFTLYAISDGMAEIFSKGYTGMCSFFKPTYRKKTTGQLQLFL